MKYLQKIATAYGYTIQRGSCDGYNGYHVYNRHHVSVGRFFDSLDSVADYFANKIKVVSNLYGKPSYKTRKGLVSPAKEG